MSKRYLQMINFRSADPAVELGTRIDISRMSLTLAEAVGYRRALELDAGGEPSWSWEIEEE